MKRGRGVSAHVAHRAHCSRNTHRWVAQRGVWHETRKGRSSPTRVAAPVRSTTPTPPHSTAVAAAMVTGRRTKPGGDEATPSSAACTDADARTGTGTSTDADTLFRSCGMADEKRVMGKTCRWRLLLPVQVEGGGARHIHDGGEVGGGCREGRAGKKGRQQGRTAAWRVCISDNERVCAAWHDVLAVDRL